METKKIKEAEKKITSELNNLYRYSSVTNGTAPKRGHALYFKWHQVNSFLTEIAKTDYNEATLLQLRYLDGMTWEQVGAAMAYTIGHLFKIREKAITLLTLKALEHKEANE